MINFENIHGETLFFWGGGAIGFWESSQTPAISYKHSILLLSSSSAVSGILVKEQEQCQRGSAPGEGVHHGQPGVRQFGSNSGRRGEMMPRYTLVARLVVLLLLTISSSGLVQRIRLLESVRESRFAESLSYRVCNRFGSPILDSSMQNSM